MNPKTTSGKLIEKFTGFTLLICILITFAGVIFLYRDKLKKNERHFQQQQAELELYLKSANQSYELIATNFFKNFINTPDVLELLTKIKDKQTKDSRKLRMELYHRLSPPYKRFHNIYGSHIHFYTHKGYSLLRLHEPKQYGDCLVTKKNIIAKSLPLKQTFNSFEKRGLYGKLYFSFPIFFNGKYLGGVTISISPESIINYLSKISPDKEFAFFLHNDPNCKIDEHKDAEAATKSTQIGSIRLMTPKRMSKVANTFNNLLKKDPTSLKALAKHSPHNISKKVNDTPYTLNLLPIKDAQGICSFYLASYSKDSIPSEYRKDHIVLSILLLIAMFVFMIMWTKLRKYEHAINQEKQNFINTCNAFPEGIFIIDSGGLIAYANPAASTLLEYTPNELIGNCPHNLLHTHQYNQNQREDCPVYKAIHTGKNYRGEQIFKKGNDNLINLEIFCSPISKQNKKAASVMVFHDLTEIKNTEVQLKSSEELQRTLMESMPIAFAIIDEKTRIIEYVNSQASKIFNLPSKEVIGNICHKFICPAEVDSCPISDLGQTIDNSDRIVLKMGKEPVPVAKTVRQIEIQGKTKILECFIDISMRKQAEEAMIQANQTKKNFLANMSHEIRTPLNAIMGMNHLLLNTNLTDAQQDYLRKSHRAAKSLMEIINKILDFSKIESNMMEIENIEFDLLDILDNVLYLVGMSLLDKKIEFTAGIDKKVPNRLKGDPLKLEQVLISLAGNAAKFTDEGFIDIWVEMVSEKEEHAKLKFTVQDSGQGIAPEKLNKLFIPFAQNDASITRNHGGTGLGLSIAESMVKLMGGTIEIESNIGKGSKFSFTIPLESLPHKKPSFDLENRRVLILDSKKNTRKLLMERIAFLGGIPEAVKTAEEAIEKLSKETIQILMICTDLPDMPYQKLQATYDIPTIIMTSAGQKEININTRKKEILLSHPIGFRTMVQALQLLLTGNITINENKHAKEHFNNAKVLVAEDNTVNQQVIQAMLQEIGLSVIVVENGRKAIDYLEKESVDLILMDIQMPGLNGFETTRKIRSKPKIKDIPIVAMTAYATKEDLMEIFAAGMNEHIIKPIEVKELIQSLKKWLPLSGKKLEKQSSKKAVCQSDGFISREKILDEKEALPRFANRRDLFHKALQKIISDYNDVEDQFRKMLEQDEMEEGRFLAHTLRGVMGNIGAKKIFETTSLLEDAFSRDQKEKADNIIKNLGCMMQDFVGHVETIHLESSPSLGSCQEEDQEEKIDLHELLKILNKRRPADSPKAIAILELMKKANNTDLDIDRLIRLIEDYEFDKAIDMVVHLV